MTGPPLRKLVLIAAALAAVAAGAWTARSGSPLGWFVSAEAPAPGADGSGGTGSMREGTPAPDADERVQALVDALQAQEDRIFRLVARVDRLEAALAASADPVPASPSEVEEGDEAANGPDDDGDRGRRFSRRFRNLSTEERRDALVAAGLTRDEAVELVTAVDEVAIRRLDLRYQAEREGWLGTARYRDAVRILPRSDELILERFGTETYDRFLYASGASNRVEVSQVMVGSTAGEAGIRTGDVVLRMDGEPVFGTRDLMRIARDGAPGELVPIELSREGGVVVTYVPRGPLGLRTSGTRVPPPG